MIIRILKTLFVAVLVAVPVLTCVSMIVDAVTLIANPTMLDWGEVPFLTISLKGGLSVLFPPHFFWSTLFLQMFSWLYCSVGWSMEGGSGKTWLRTTWRRFKGLALLLVGVVILAMGSMAFLRGFGAACLYGIGWILIPILCGLILALLSLVFLMVFMVAYFLFSEGLRLLRGKGETSIPVAQ